LVLHNTKGSGKEPEKNYTFLTITETGGLHVDEIVTALFSSGPTVVAVVVSDHRSGYVASGGQ